MDPPWSKEILQPSSTPSSEPLQPGSGVLKWFKTLQDNGCLWEASRILRILLPVLPMLPSKDLVLLIFGEQQSLGKASAEDDGSELGESDKWAHVSMNLSKARILLDTIVRENSPSTVSHFSHEILYTMGQGYVKMARMQELGKPNPEVMLEERDYSLIGENIQLSNPSRELQKFQISSKDYKLHALKIGDESVRSKDENHSSNSANWDEAMRQIPLENRLGFVRAWEILATIILSKSIDKPAKSILAGEREAFQASMMATGSPQRKGAGKTRRGEYSPEDTLKDATQTICDYKFAETLSYDQNSMKKNYPMRFDIPLYIKAFIQRREQLSANNLMFLDREDDAIKKIDLQTVQSCLPDFIKNSDQLGTRASDEGEIRIVNIQGSVEVGGDMTISGRVNVFVPGDLLVKGTLNISDGASVHQSTPMVGSANIDAIQNLPEGSERAEYRGIYGLLGRSLNIFWAPTRR
ncbi:hypothetical protein DL98DRAFT_521658 [Cadophora sp. DSE1049]|nr:hypothetical protein DL98DRAFT_521658 [Cadophora sp. DSE1049]